MTAQDLRETTERERREELSGLLRAPFNLRPQRGIGQLSTPPDLRRVRKDIARVKTSLTEKSKGEAS